MTIVERRLDAVCDGLRLSGGAYLPDGPRGVVVLLHGIPSSAPPDPGDEGYPGLARRFAERGWAAAWADMRAVRSSPGHFSIEGWVRDATAVIEAARALDGAGGLPLAVVGSSAGGCVSAEAVARGTTVDALVLLAAPAAWLSFADDAPAAVERIVQGAGMSLADEVLADPAAWASEFEAVVTERAIVSVRAPVLVVHGTDDDVVPVDHARTIGARSPRVDVRIIEGAGHQLRRDERAIEIVFEWLDRSLPEPR